MNHVTSVTYDANTGLVTRATDQNGNATDYSYDGMLRVTKELGPADANGNRPETDLAYPDANTVQKSVVIKK